MARYLDRKKMLFSWLVAALLLTVYAVMRYFARGLECIPSSCEGEICTTDCNGPRSYDDVIRLGIFSVIVWLGWTGYWRLGGRNQFRRVAR